MARLPRYVHPGQSRHVIQRGNNRSIIFAGEDDYRFYLECLADAAKKNAYDIHAYVLMTNHVHLLATPHHEDCIAKTMQPSDDGMCSIQPYLPAHRHALGGAIQGHVNRQRGVSADLLSLHRAQSGASWHGFAPARISVVKLSLPC